MNQASTRERPGSFLESVELDFVFGNEKCINKFKAGIVFFVEFLGKKFQNKGKKRGKKLSIFLPFVYIKLFI